MTQKYGPVIRFENDLMVFLKKTAGWSYGNLNKEIY
jgi:hypothetical protein